MCMVTLFLQNLLGEHFFFFFLQAYIIQFKERKITLLPERNNQSNKSVVIRMQAVVHPVFLTSLIY